MRTVFVVVLAIVFAASAALAQETKTEKSTQEMGKQSAAKARWHGTIVRHSDEHSTFDVKKKGAVQKIVVYDSSTKWTANGKPAERSAFKDGSEIVAVGTWDKDGRLIAHEIDLRQ